MSAPATGIAPGHGLFQQDPFGRPDPFAAATGLLDVVARALNEGFWGLREASYAWTGLRGVDREVFYLVAEAVIPAAAS